MKIGLSLSYYGLLMCSYSIAAGKKNIMANMKPASWISDEDFSTIMTLSYPTSICCNIYIREFKDGLDVLFQQFRKVYRYQYLLRRRIYACQGYFFLGTDENEVIKALEKIPSTKSTTEILIMISKNISADSNLLNVTLYRNGNANVLSPSGIWILSENYLLPRVFKKVNRYEEMARKRGLINLQGRELLVATTYLPPSCYLRNGVNKTVNGMEVLVFFADNDNERDGVEFKIFLILAQKLNFTWTIMEPLGVNKYGLRLNDSVLSGGLIGSVGERKIDMSFATIWLTLDHARSANMSESWYQLYLHFLVPRPGPFTSFWALTRPFSVEVWITLITLIFAQSITVFVHARINPAYPQRLRHFVVTLTEMIGSFLGGIIPKTTAGARLQMLLWHTGGLLIATAYCSSLAARLASSEYEDRIDTIEQFLQRNLSWGKMDTRPAFHEYFDLNDKYSSQLPSKYITLSSMKQAESLIALGNYAVIGTIVDSLFFPDHNISNKDLSKYRVMKESVGKFYACFAVQPWLLESVNKVMLSLKESGITFFHLRDVLRRRVNFHLREVVIERDHSDDTARELTLTPLGAGFSILITGLLISTCVFYFELKYARIDKSIPAVLRDIREKRKIFEFMKSKNSRSDDKDSFHRRIKSASHNEMFLQFLNAKRAVNKTFL